MDDLHRASLIAGHGAAWEIIRSDERARQKWDSGSISKAMGLLEVWASSIMFMHLTDEKHRVPALHGTRRNCVHTAGSRDPQGSTGLVNFPAAVNERPGEGCTLRWQVLLCRRTFRARQDEGVPQSLDLGALEPCGHNMVEAFPALDVSLFTDIQRLTLLGDTRMARSAGAGAAYRALRKARRPAWRRFTDWLRWGAVGWQHDPNN